MAKGECDLLLTAAALPGWLASRDATAVTVVVDEAVSGSQVDVAVDEVVRAGTRAVTRLVVPLAGGQAPVQSLTGALVDADPDVVVGVGGGTLLDRVKLANVLAGGAVTVEELAGTGRAGFHALTDGLGRRALLVAVPTTLGTGSERSGNAVLDLPRGRQLLSGRALQPEAAVLDARATRTLPRALVLQGIYEALSRTAAPYATGSGAAPAQDQLVEAVAARLACIGEQLRDVHDPGASAHDPLRLEVARLSGMSHTAAMHRGRDPFGFKAWYLAHELAWQTGTTKNEALAVLLPAVWSDSSHGAPCWGSVQRLRVVWRAVVSAAAPMALGDEPGEGLEQLVTRWQLPRRTTAPVDVARLVDRTMSRWGDGLPFLAGVDAGDVERVLRAALHGDRHPGSGAPATVAAPALSGRTRT